MFDCIYVKDGKIIPHRRNAPRFRLTPRGVKLFTKNANRRAREAAVARAKKS